MQRQPVLVAVGEDPVRRADHQRLVQRLDELDIPERWGSGTWTPDKGYQFLKENLPISEGQLNFEFTRYLGWPGQAPSYKVGQRLWEQIRTELEARPGFDLKEFHTRALNIGSVGLDTLRRALLS